MARHPETAPVRCLVVLGPTATGKTRLGVALARIFNGEIISADSRQLFRGMDLGTGKDLDEYGTGDQHVPHHLIDILDPTEDYHLFRYVSDAHAAMANIQARGRLPVIVGGTALYLNALLNGYLMEGGNPDPKLREHFQPLADADLLERLRQEAPDIYERTDHTQRRRILRALEIAFTRNAGTAPPSFPPLEALLVGPFYPRPIIHRRIEKRLDERLQQGLVEEVAKLHEQGVSWQRLDNFGLEYRYAAQYLQQQIDLATFRNTLLARIRRLCKSQEIWFRKMEREGKRIHWIPEGNLRQAECLVRDFLDGKPLPPPSLRLSDNLYGPQTQ